VTPSTIQTISAALFAVALLHTFSTRFFEQLANVRPTHAGLWHLLGEVEVVFGFWAMILILFMFAVEGRDSAIHYLDSRNFTEPMFVFAIMVIAGTKPVLQLAMLSVRTVALFIPLPQAIVFYFTTLSLVPLLGSFITEPAAMTLAALILRDNYFSRGISPKLKYTTLGVLFVNVSIGGTLTPFAAPPVLMVAGKWGWDIWFMISTFGWKAAIAVIINAGSATLLFRHELSRVATGQNLSDRGEKVPGLLVAVHLLFLIGIVTFAHHPAAFMGLFLFFIGIAHAYKKHQNRFILREGLLVAFFLAGLVVLGGQQQWWLQPLLLGLSSEAVFFSATLLTAITDNAALTYLGSLVEGLSDSFKYALVAGAVTGGGLTIIANAPNPAGVAILRGNFEDATIHPLGLLTAAIPPTIVALLAFRLL
jgi:Na+/H+ antiporter NhaD/arsenite permease-like protein